MNRWIWLVFVAACGAQPQQPTPVGNATVAAGKDDQPKPPASLPIAGHERIHFETNKDVLAAAEKTVLDTIVARLKADADLNLQVSGHTDPSEIGADDTTPNGLSYARAIAVRSYLMGRGIAERRLLVRAVGSSEPRGDDRRRVEFETVTIKINASGGRVVITDTDVEILDPVMFERGKVTIAPTSFPALDAVVATLQGNPTIQLVEVQSHVDERGDATKNLRLTQARAKVIASYLVSKGVDPARLTHEGYGSTQPLDRAHTEAAWAKNTRIAFLILKRSP